MDLHSTASNSTLDGEHSVSVVFNARFRDLVFSARDLRALSDFSLDSNKEEAAEDREGRSEGRSRDCQLDSAVSRGVSSLLSTIMLGIVR